MSVSTRGEVKSAILRETLRLAPRLGGRRREELGILFQLHIFLHIRGRR